MHQASREFMESLKRTMPRFFKEKNVLEVGSQDINGTNNYLFENCRYFGLDLGPGNNVNVVSHVADYNTEDKFDTIISTNAFEHDKRYVESISAIVLSFLKPRGLFAFSCASLGSQEHGTTEHYSGHSPHTNDHYKNLVESDIRQALNFDEHFDAYSFLIHGVDLQFWGIKKDEN